MANWHLLIEEDLPHPQLTLVCTDAGEITSVELEHDVDNYPCVAGKIVADGRRMCFQQKHSATAAYQGIHIGHGDEFCRTIPDRIPVRCESRAAWADLVRIPFARQREMPGSAIPETMDLSFFSKEQLQWEIKYVVADPRIIWMAFYVLGNDKWLSARMCAHEIPTREEAIAKLRHYGLYRPYSIHNKCPDDVYETMSRIWAGFVRRHHEECAARIWNRTVHFEETTILPDETHDTFVKNLRVVGSFAVPYFEYTIRDLKPDERVKLVREPGNPHDPNAIRVEAPFVHGEILGYLPRTDAAVFAPEIDAGTAYAAWISSVNAEKQQVFLDIYKHIQFPMDDVTGIHFVQNGYQGEQISFELSLGKRKLIFTRRESRGDLREQHVELTFAPECWEDILVRLRKCNLQGWRRAYHNYSRGESRFWELEIRRRKASRILISGCADYPEEWESFLSLIDDCLDLNKVKGDGRVFLTTVEPPPEQPERRT